MKHTGSAKKKSKSNGSSIKKRAAAAAQYVICVKNEEYPSSLELRKLYPVMADRNAAKAGLIRVVDESGEDYLYPADYFIAIKLPRPVQKAVRLAS